jgi:hypothetical protein
MNKKFHKLWETKTKEDEWWSSFVTSPLAILINYFVVDYKWLTPNLITLFSFIVAIVATGFILAMYLIAWMGRWLDIEEHHHDREVISIR